MRELRDDQRVLVTPAVTNVLRDGLPLGVSATSRAVTRVRSRERTRIRHRRRRAGYRAAPQGERRESLMPGAYPPLTVEIPQGPAKIPPVKVLTNWLIFIPQFIWVYILSIVAFFAAIVCWFSIVFTGTASESLSEFIAGVIRYQWRVITGLFVWAEPYPPFTPIPQGFADPGGYPAVLNVTPASGERNRGTVRDPDHLCIPQFIVLYVLNIANGDLVSSSRGSSPCSPGNGTRQSRTSASACSGGSFGWRRITCLLNDEYPPFSLEP